MEFKLDILSEAFELREYRDARRKFRLFSFLLATSADKGIFPEILAHVDELHYLTDKYILLIAPRMAAKVRGRTADDDAIRRILSTGVFPQWFGGNNESMVDVSATILEFLQKQTRESYNLIRALGEKETVLPCLVFFRSLKEPSAYALWSLKGMDAFSVLRSFRELQQILVERCHWEAPDRLSELKNELSRLVRQSEVDSNQAQSRFAKLFERARSWKQLIHRIEEVRHAPERNYPIDNVIRLLINPGAFGGIGELRKHLANYANRWRARLPLELRTAIDTFEKECASTDWGSLTFDVDQLKSEFDTAKEDLASQYKSRSVRIEAKIVELEGILKREPEDPLEVVRSFDRKKVVVRKLRAAGSLLPWIRTGASLEGLFS